MGRGGEGDFNGGFMMEGEGGVKRKRGVGGRGDGLGMEGGEVEKGSDCFKRKTI